MWLAAATKLWPASWREPHLRYDWCGLALLRLHEKALCLSAKCGRLTDASAHYCLHAHGEMYAYVSADLDT